VCNCYKLLGFYRYIYTIYRFKY